MLYFQITSGLSTLLRKASLKACAPREASTPMSDSGSMAPRMERLATLVSLAKMQAALARRVGLPDGTQLPRVLAAVMLVLEKGDYSDGLRACARNKVFEAIRELVTVHGNGTVANPAFANPGEDVLLDFNVVVSALVLVVDKSGFKGKDNKKGGFKGKDNKGGKGGFNKKGGDKKGVRKSLFKKKSTTNKRK